MSWGAVAVAGAAVGGSLLSSRSASKATAAQSKASSDELAFNQQRYDDWINVYGPIQDNLSDYYEQLTPEYYATMGLEEFEKERASAQEALTTNLAQRGIAANSGVALQLQNNLDTQSAETRASIRRNAQSTVNQEKQNFLSIGIGSNPAGNVANTLANQTANATNLANAANTAAGQSWGNTVNTLFQSGGLVNNLVTGLSSQQAPAPITAAKGTLTGR